jgi:hypothetical protein
MNKFFELWLSLTAAERLRLLKFAESPYFNDTAWLVPLVRAMQELPADTVFPSFGTTKDEDTTLDKRLFAAVFSENEKSKAFDAQKYNRLLSDATRYMLRFIQIEGLPAPDTAAIWYEKSVFKRYEAANLQAQQALDEQQLRDSAHYAMRLRSEKLAFEYAQKTQSLAKRSNLDELHRALDVYFLAEKLRYTCEVLNNQNVLQHTYAMQGVNEILAWLTESDYRSEPPIAVYLQVYTLLNTQSEADFTTLKMLLQRHETHFSATELKELYGYTINFCIRQVNGGNEKYLSEYLNIIEILLHNKAIFVQGELAVPYYKNTVTIGLRANEYDRIEHFIRNYSQFLPKEQRENAVTYNLAKLYFAKASQENAPIHYEKVLEFLHEVDYDNVFYALDSRWLLLKTYYALQETTVLENTMLSFRIYLLRNATVSNYTKQQYLELLALFKKLIALPQKKRANAISLYAKIEQKNIVADKKWLLAQVACFL